MTFGRLAAGIRSQQLPSSDELEAFLGADDWKIIDFVVALGIIVASLLVAGLVRRLGRRILSRWTNMSEFAVDLVSRSLGWVVILIGFISGVSIIGINLGPAVVLVLVIVVVLFFAGRGIMANFAAGLVLQGSPMFTLGDVIETGGAVGIVRAVTARTVVLETADGTEVAIPNKAVVGGIVANISKLGYRASMVTVEAAYGSSVGEVKKALREAAASCDEAVSEPPPEALLLAFRPSGIEFAVRFWHEPGVVDQMRAVDAVATAVSASFAASGIVIPLPQVRLGTPGEGGY